jgi:hypothetical protein
MCVHPPKTKGDHLPVKTPAADGDNPEHPPVPLHFNGCNFNVSIFEKG